MSSNTPEGKAKTRFRNALRALCADLGVHLWLQGASGGAFGAASLDYIGSILTAHRITGIPFAVEVKRFDEPAKLTKRQQVTTAAMQRAGIVVFSVTTEAELQGFLTWVKLASATQ